MRSICLPVLMFILSAVLLGCVPQISPPSPQPAPPTFTPAAVPIAPPPASLTVGPAATPGATSVFATVPLESKSPTAAPSLTLQPSATPAPLFSRVYLIVMENQEYSDIVGSPNAPYLNQLIAQYGLATNYFGVTHPSEPNYFALFSGSTQGVTDDGVYDLDGANLADQLEAKGRTWRVFAENVPLGCFTGAVGMNGEDGTGAYARKHNPAISFTGIRKVPSRCANITDLTHFDPTMADYSLVVPNLCHDMHDCSVAAGDTFLKGWVPRLLASSAWQSNAALFVAWDEGTSNQGGGGHIPLLVIARQVTRGFQSSRMYNHYSLLRTIENAWGLGCLNETCKANDLSEFFR